MSEKDWEKMVKMFRALKKLQDTNFSMLTVMSKDLDIIFKKLDLIFENIDLVHKQFER